MEEYPLTVPRRIFGSGQGGRPSRTRDSDQKGAKRPIPVRFVSHGGTEGEGSLRLPFLRLILRPILPRMVRHFSQTPHPLGLEDLPHERCRHSRPILQVHPRRPGTAGERAPGLPPSCAGRTPRAGLPRSPSHRVHGRGAVPLLHGSRLFRTAEGFRNLPHPSRAGTHIWSLPRLQEGGSRQKEGRSVHISGLVMETLCFRASMKHSSTLA